MSVYFKRIPILPGIVWALGANPDLVLAQTHADGPCYPFTVKKYKLDSKFQKLLDVNWDAL
jgi:hypothetical protein